MTTPNTPAESIGATDAVTTARNERQALLAAAIAHADGLPEGDRVAVAVKVFQAVLEQARQGGTFRYLIYDRLGFSPDAYLPLYYAGGMHISDGFVLTDELPEDEPAIVGILESLAKAAPMQPHPTLKRADGSPIPWPTPQRSQLFSATHLMRELLDSNRALVEANRRLSAQCELLEQAREQNALPPDAGKS
jgi:hypothetical protein